MLLGLHINGAKEVIEEREKINDIVSVIGDSSISDVDDGTLTGGISALNRALRSISSPDLLVVHEGATGQHPYMCDWSKYSFLIIYIKLNNNIITSHIVPVGLFGNIREDNCIIYNNLMPGIDMDALIIKIYCNGNYITIYFNMNSIENHYTVDVYGVINEHF